MKIIKHCQPSYNSVSLAFLSIFSARSASRGLLRLEKVINGATVMAPKGFPLTGETVRMLSQPAQV